MPQSTPERRARWQDDETACKYLRKRGYVLLHDWCWQEPKNHKETAADIDAIIYLMEEYDFGGVRGDR